MPIPRTKSYSGPALFSYGFRPFFLFASAYTALSILLWLPLLHGELELYTAFAPVSWHIHEWLFGFLPAVITGFLFTAVPNWTGRMPLQGWPLAGLLSLWIAGRLAVAFSVKTGWAIAAFIDLSFLAVVAIVIAREIIAGNNWRNLKVLIPLSLLLIANAVFHYESMAYGLPNYGTRLGFAAAITLIILIGGRIIPSFTRNWLVRENPGRLPSPFGPIDKIAIATSIPALAGWVLFPDSLPVSALLFGAGLMQLFRLSRWAGYRTLGDPLVAILHASYLFIPLGMILLATGIAFPAAIPQAAGLHALGVGGIGGMTLSVMTRASLGHTGRELKASRFTTIIFVSILIAALARIAQALSIGNYELMVHVSGFGWLLAFGGFAVTFAPALLSARRT